MQIPIIKDGDIIPSGFCQFKDPDSLVRIYLTMRKPFCLRFKFRIKAKGYGGNKFSLKIQTSNGKDMELGFWKQKSSEFVQQLLAQKLEAKLSKQLGSFL